MDRMRSAWRAVRGRVATGSVRSIERLDGLHTGIDERADRPSASSRECKQATHRSLAVGQRRIETLMTGAR